MSNENEKIICYKKLFKLLIDRNMKQKELAEVAGISVATLTKMKRGNGAISTLVWVKICVALNCQISDIVELIPIAQ